ncbi:hypothetical protein P43SY_010525 [Pythium insidiosum]|uniref:Uncharacterized protein n=1 Tax=Pythium insidiosum TaxID=114742 RepID=A0AAD5Q237_PYTIN|nr:hypothetical protein P43SY_010525 [Pythium insidiosum]
MASTAAVMLDWQPVFILEKENFQLREENRHLHDQVQELMRWKEKALKHMVALGPKRSQAQRDVQHATQLQRKLQEMEKSLLQRVELEEANAALQLDAQQQREWIQALSERNLALEARVEQLAAREAAASEMLQQLADAFRLHLEQLVAIRERIDAHDDDAQRIEEDSPAAEENSVQQDPAAGPESPALLIAGLSAISDKCLRWFHYHVAQTYARIQEKAALYESQNAELEQLRDRVR